MAEIISNRNGDMDPSVYREPQVGSTSRSFMDFPSFGDAALYSQAGAACAAALTGGTGGAFAACYDPIRPLGIVAWSTVPHLLARDPVDVAYLTLTVNILLVCAVYLLLRHVLLLDPQVRPGAGPLSARALSAAVFVTALLNLIPHVPVTLSDLPSLALFLPAVVLCARVLLAPVPALARRRYLLAGVFTALAALVRQHYLAFGLFLLVATLWLDRRRETTWHGRIRCAAAFLIGLLPVLLQVVNVYAHSGEIWFYERARVAGTFGRPHKDRIVEALFFSIPQQGGFMVKLAEPRSLASVIALRLFSGLFQFQWAVYQGHIAPGREWWTPTTLEMLRAWAGVLAWLALSVFTVARGPRALRLLNLTALLSALAVPWFGVGHTELRYYLLPRLVLWVTAVYWTAHAIRAARGQPAP
jgi:hypothetical protein